MLAKIKKTFYILSIIFFSISSYAKKPKIAVVVKSLNNEFFKEMRNGIEQYKTIHSDKVEVIFKGVQTETDHEGQLKIINELVKAKIDALVIAPVDSSKVVPTVLKLLNQNIIVINMDNKIDDRELAKYKINIPFVGPSNFNGAKEAGAVLAQEKLKNGDKVAIIEGLSSSVNAKSRSEGFREAMREAQVTVAQVKSADWEEAKAYEVTTQFLKEIDNLKAILCGNDTMAIGAIKAIEKLNFKDKVFVVGYDNIPSIKQYFKTKELFATVDQFPALQATTSIDLAVEAVNKKMKQSDLPNVLKTKTGVILKD
ncbi:substrate-binding domain-containing protein [Pigmentibacter ruber]|uniref:substrate-binding domain-containing protein n=1 Tax=Pigmentibacter ruber TaxID=2683196 RepID=UPI00131B4401|nr:substrate-binding domain-containing protein [Pigmentibacter ruber]BFD31123.1 sugar ABC transporter substrate-binding protein [Pigmentibacter ruber]